MNHRLPATLLLAGVGAVAIGAALDQLWPYSLLILRVESGPGPLLVAAGASLAVGVAVVWLARYQWRKARLAAASARAKAADWEQRACALEDAHRRFMRDLDHELKNPLQAIRTALARLDGDPEAATASVETARHQVERLRRLSGRLRQLATVESGTLARERVDLEDLVDEAVELARRAASGADSRITLTSQRLPWPLEPVMADRELLSQAIYNLLDNALKYSPPGSPVEVRLREDGASATVEIADQGRGILNDDVPHIFDELYRGQSAHDIEGSGLGLSLARRVAVAHGGELELRSRPGQGTIASLRLPLERA